MSRRQAEVYIQRIAWHGLLSVPRGPACRFMISLVAAAFLGVCAAAMPPCVSAIDLASVGLKGTSGNNSSNGVVLDGDGSVVAFYSDASDLVVGDTNQARDVFVRDLNAGKTERVSVSSTGQQANGPSQASGGVVGISDNGQVVAFYSDATNLVPNDTNGQRDVFVRDRGAATTELISQSTGGVFGNGASTAPSISADGRFVAFQSQASNLVPDDSNGVADIFVRDRVSGTTERVCGVQGNAFSFSPSISADGTLVAFASAASNLVPNDTNGRVDIFVCDRTANVIERVSVASSGQQGDGDSILPTISGNGRIVAFKSLSDNLVSNDRNGTVDVFLHDRLTGVTERISVDPNGRDANDFSFPPSVSADGRYVAFGSFATNIVLNDIDFNSDVFVRDRRLGITLVISPAEQCGVGTTGADGGTPDIPPSVSRDGKRVGFVSFANNLVPNDKNQLSDVFVSDNPFFAPGSCPDGTCSSGQVCVTGCCVAATPTGTPTRPGTPGTPTKTPTKTPTPTPFPCFIDLDCPRGQICIDNKCEVVNCTSDADCPDNRSCVDGICQAKPITPTPLPTCSVDSDCVTTCSVTADCPTGKTCQNGSCAPADRCRAGVCVPPRECDDTDPSIDRTNCRGERETCVANTCECGGDCNLDGLVFGNEISQMLCVVGGVCPLSECPAGDFDGNGQISGNEVCQAVTNLGLGCPGEGLPLFAHDRPQDVRTIDVGSATGSPGGTVPITINLGGGGDVATAQLDLLFDTTVLDITDPPTQCSVAPRLNATETSFNFLPRRPNAPDNEARLRLFVADLMLCQDNLSYPFDAFDEGPLLACTFQIKANAPLGPSQLTPERLNIGDARGNTFGLGSTPGVLTVQACTADDQCGVDRLCRNGICEPTCTSDTECKSDEVCRTGACVPKCTQNSDCTSPLVCINNFCVPTCTQDIDCPYNLVCRDAVCVPQCTQDNECPTGSTCQSGGCVPETLNTPTPTGTPSTPTPTGTPPTATPTPECSTSGDCGTSGRDSCVAGKCLCAGDCDGDGTVTSLEITDAIEIFGEVLSVNACPAADQDGDGHVSALEITIAIQNFGLGCPQGSQ